MAETNTENEAADVPQEQLFMAASVMEARDERRLLRKQKQMGNVKLLIIDELGFVPLSKTGAGVMF